MYVEGKEEVKKCLFDRVATLLTCLQSNRIGDGGVVALARALEHNRSITVVNIRVCEERGDI